MILVDLRLGDGQRRRHQEVIAPGAVEHPALAGMTGAETERTAELLRDLAQHHAVVVVEHDMAFVRSLGGRITVLHQGTVIADGSMAHVQADPRVIEVYLGD